LDLGDPSLRAEAAKTDCARILGRVSRVARCGIRIAESHRISMASSRRLRQTALSLGPVLCFAMLGLSAGCSDSSDPTADEGTSGSGGGTSGATTTSTTVGSGSATGGSAGTLPDGGATGGSSNSDPCLPGPIIDDLEKQGDWSQWRLNHDDTAGGHMTPSGTFAAEMTTDGHGYAAHLSGDGYVTWGAGLVRKFDPGGMCVGSSKGIKFKAKGSTATSMITVAAAMSNVLGASEGGTCTDQCNNSHETRITLTDTWAEKTLDWTSLAQPDWGPRVAFNPKNVLQLLFTARPTDMKFDVWLDDIQLVGGTGSAPGVDAGPPGSCVLDAVLGAQTFAAWFPSRNGVYTYAGMCTALKKSAFSRFASSSDPLVNKREVAAFFAHVAWETGDLVFTDQQSKDPATGNYWGRGPLQLTWDYNYRACGTDIGVDLIGQPNLVSTDSVVTWETAFWFWLYDDSGKGFTAHDAIVRGSFGDTLRVVNSIECTPGNQYQQNRINNYTEYCRRLGVTDLGSPLTCG